jgi:hypothetical protein
MQTFFLSKGERSLSKIVAFLSSLSKSRRWKLEISEDRCTRSVQQCRYLNGVAYKILGERTGYERDDISEYCCGRYFGWKTVKVPRTPNNPNGIEDRPIRTTTTDENGNRSVLSTTEFMDYVAFVQRFAASKGIHIPDPNEELEEEEQRRAA